MEGEFDFRESLSEGGSASSDNEGLEGRLGGDDAEEPEPRVNGRTLDNPSSTGSASS